MTLNNNLIVINIVIIIFLGYLLGVAIFHESNHAKEVRSTLYCGPPML